MNGSKTLLVVDDDTMLREAFVFDFQRRGYHVLSAANGTEAFEIAKRERPDAVITDVRMPNGTGVELLDNIKSLNARIPVVIFVTGFSDLSTEDAHDKGAFAVMSKPFDRKALADVVSRSLLGAAERLSVAREIAADAPRIELPRDLGAAPQEAALRFGQGGMSLVNGSVQVKVDQAVSFRIDSPGQELPPLSGHGIVRWIREPGSSRQAMGIEFTFLDPSCRQAVVAFLDTLAVKAFIPKAQQ